MLPRINNTFAIARDFGGHRYADRFSDKLQLHRSPPPQAPASQSLPTLTLQQAQALAIQNHPQIQAAQNEINYSNQQIIENRSAYYPDRYRRCDGLAGQHRIAARGRRPLCFRGSSIASARARWRAS